MSTRSMFLLEALIILLTALLELFDVTGSF